MINWLLEQTLVLSCFILLFALCGPFLRKIIGATALYTLWLAIPIFLLVNNFGMPISVETPVQQFVVTAKETTSTITYRVENFHSAILFIWASFSVFLFVAVVRQHYAYLKQLDLRSLTHTVLTDQFGVGEKANQTNLKVYTSEHVNSPFVTGIFKPVLIVPSQFNKNFSQLQRQLILQHESVHHKRKDLIWNGLATAITILFWFNPFSWYGLRLFRQSQEVACDQRVVETLSNKERQAYASAMLDCAVHGEKLHFTVINYGAKNLMKDRITTINTHKKKRFGLTISACILVLSTFVGASIAGAKLDGFGKPGSERPVKRIEPRYPLEAARQGIEGSVVLSFDINTNGSVSNVNVVEAIPEGVFGNNAKIALEQWTYEPMDKKIVGMTVQLDFKLGPDSETKADLALTEPRETIAVIK